MADVKVIELKGGKEEIMAELNRLLTGLEETAAATRDRALNERCDEVVDALQAGEIPYDETSYRALAQLAAEMEITLGIWEKFVPFISDEMREFLAAQQEQAA